MTTASEADRESSAEASQLLVAALSSAIRRLAAGETAAPPSRDLPFERERLAAMAAMLGFDEPDVVALLVDDAPGMLAFVAQIEAALAPNRYLCDFLREASARHAEGRLELKRDLTSDPTAAFLLIDVVHYTWFLHRLTLLLTADPTGAWLDRLDRAISARFANARWEQHLDTFQRMKVRSLRSLGRWAKVKRGERNSDREVRWRLSINVLEAMGEDWRRGYDDNAAAGLAMVESPPSLWPVPGLGNALVSFDALGRQVATPPEPKLWADLYTTWNLAFVSDYPAAPYFFAKLICPVVADYHHAPGLYLNHRGVALVLHIWFSIASRLDPQRWATQVDWREPALTRLWGEMNLRSASDYRARVEAPALQGYRRRVRFLWAVIRRMVSWARVAS